MTHTDKPGKQVQSRLEQEQKQEKSQEKKPLPKKKRPLIMYLEHLAEHIDAEVAKIVNNS